MNWQVIPHAQRMPLERPPAKGVMKLIERIEVGELIPVFLDSNSDYPLKESFATHEAYVRCHMSMIPCVYKEEKKDANRNPVPAPEPDEERPF